MECAEELTNINRNAGKEDASAVLVNGYRVRPGMYLTNGATVTLGGVFAVRGLRLMEGKNGPFLNFPSYKSGNGYQDICFPVSAQLRQQMTDAAVTAYHQVLDRHQAETAAQSQAELEEPEPASGIGMQM